MAEACGVVDLEEAKDRSTGASEVADELEKEESGGLGCSETVEEVKVGASVSSAETEKQAAKEESAAGSPADQDPVDGSARVDAAEGISPSEKKESAGDEQVTTPPETEVPLVDDDQKSQKSRTEYTKLADTAEEMHPQVSSIETNQGLQEEDDDGIASHVDLVAKDPVLDDLCRGEMGVRNVDMVDAAHASADLEPVDVVGVVHAESLGSESEANDESRLNLQKEDLASQPDRVAKEQPPSNSTVEVQNQEIGGETVESNKPVMDDSQGRDHKSSIRNIEEGDVVLDTAPVDDTLGHQADCGVVDTSLADTISEVQPQVKEGGTDVGCGSLMDDYHTEDEDASISKTNPVVTDKSNEEGDCSFDSVPVSDVIDHQTETYLDDPTGKALAKERGVDTDVDDGYIMKVNEVKDGVRGVHEVSNLQISSVETSQDLQEGDNEQKPNHIDSNIDSPADPVKDSVTADPEVEVQPQLIGREMEVANVEIMDVDQDSNVGITAGPNQPDPVVVEVQTQVICQESEAGNESMMNLPKDTTTVGDIINLQADCVSEHANLDDLAVKSHSEIRSIETDEYDGFMMKSGEGKDHKVSGSHTPLTENDQNSQVELETVLDSVLVEADHFTKHPDQVNLVKEPEVSAGSDVDGDQERESEASACESSLMKTNQQIQEEANTSFNPVVLDEAVDYQAVRAAEDKNLINRGSVITTTLDGLGTLSVAEAEKEDANPVTDEPLGSGYSLKPRMHLSQNFADLAAASSESLPVQVCAMTEGDTTTMGFGCVADSVSAEEQEAFVSKMHLVENTREDEKLLDSFAVGDKINHQADCASQDPDPADPSIELKARIENIEADGSDRFVMEGDENKDQEASLLQASLTATNQDVLEESDTLLNYVPPEADCYTNDTNQVNQSMEVKSDIVRTEIEVSDVPEVDADQDRDREASALKSSLVEIQGEGNTMFNSVSVDDTIDHEVNCMPLDKNLTTGFGIVTAKLDGVMSVSVTELENGDANSVNDSSLGSKYSVVSGAGLTQNFGKFGAQSADTHPLDENTMVQGDVTKADANPVELQSRDTQVVDHNLVDKQDISELVSCSVVEPVNCGIGSLGENLMVTGDTVLENSNSVVEANTWRASELSEIRTVLSQGKGYIDLLQDADLDIEMQLVGISVDESICANAHKVESSLGKSQIIITDSEVVNNGGMPQASACKRVESIQELEAKKEIQDPKNEVSSLKDEVAVGKQNVKVGKGELLKGTEKQAVKCLDTSIGGIPGMENKQHISYNLIFVDTANFSISDLVWGKVKSHPWWPGQIIDPSDASKLALKYQKKDNFLVAYFGDKTFAWCDDSQLKPFYSYFSQMEKQCSSDTFATAMNDILVEISRRVELGMTCSCFPDESYANIKFQKVDNAGVRKGNVTSFLDRPQVLNYFQPGELLEYIKTLAQFPNGGVDRLELVIAKSQLKAFYCSKGYPELPIFTVHRGLIEDVAEIPLSNVKGSGEDNAEHSTPDVPGLGSGKGKLRSSDNSSKKRKHVLEDDGKQKSTSGLTNEENALHLGDDGKSKCGLEASETLILSSSGMKHTVLGSDCTDSGRHKKRTPDFFGDIEPTSPSPTVISSFKIGEFIRRAASHLTGAPPIVKCQQESTPKNALQTDPRKGVVTDFDVLPHAPEENKAPETNLSENNSSPDEMFSQLCLAARDPMNGDSSMSMIVDFFSSFRNSCVSCIREGKKHVEKRKRGRPRKVISQPLFSELFSDISSSEEKPVEKRKRCRPKKYSDTAISDIGSSEEKHVKKCSSENQHVEKRRRGRPKKVIPQPAVSDIGSSEEKHAEKPKRGRPRKVTSQLASSDMSTPDHMKDSYWSDTNLEKRPRKKSLSDLKRKGESHEQTQQKKRKSAGGRPLSLPSVSMLENEQKLQLVAMNTNIKYPFIAERPIISVAEKIVDERMPTALILSFSSSDTLPSPTDLIRIFSRYGPLKEAETDVVIKTNCAKVVFKRRVDAEAAFSSAGKYSIFGPGLLSYQLKSLSLTTKPSQQTTQENHDTTSIVMPQDNLNPTIATLQGDHDQVISVAQNEHDEDLMTTPQDKHDTTASASKPEENHDTASVVIPQGNLNPTIATLQGDHDQVISVVEHDEDPMITPQDNHDTTTSASKPEENHDTASIVIPRENLNPTIANLQGDHDQAISVAPNEHDEELMTTPQDVNDTTMVSRPQNDDSGAITTPDETKDAELIHGCNLETSEVAEGGFALDIILVEAEAKLSPQVKYDAISIPQPEYYNDAASIPTPEKKNDAGLMQGCNLEISEVAEGGIALDTILVEAEAGLPQVKYDATSIPQPKEYHDAAPIAAPQDKLDSTTTSGDYHDAAPITSTEDQYETTQIESSSSLTEDKHDATVTTEHSDYHDAAPIVASPDYHDATPNTASQEYQGATPTTALQENYEATQEQSETVMEVDKIQVETEEESSR
ncbi:uncharacterized protein M6B38_144295 [Iris pallida]|uniref:PWWP domain-containing protein n=2 Tax=Iris pallida TaxID=29817 RepID=A0AAX6FAT5_IRIPA|nr:uncharacterized protein M6B38_144295 [Iris pallida]